MSKIKYKSIKVKFQEKKFQETDLELHKRSLNLERIYGKLVKVVMK